jgi:hypothetical protein
VHRLLVEQREDGGSYVAPAGSMAGLEAAPAEVPVVAAVAAALGVTLCASLAVAVSWVYTDLAVLIVGVVVHQGFLL